MAIRGSRFTVCFLHESRRRATVTNAFIGG
jgi:hypothetical protein